MSIKMEADVVVVACGMSGLCAATQAQESLNATGGGTVVAFEKTGTVGGAANMGMAFLAIESQLQKENMTNDFTLGRCLQLLHGVHPLAF